MISSLFTNIYNNQIFKGVSEEHINKYIHNGSVFVVDFPADTVAYSSKSEKMQVAFILQGIARVYTGSDKENALLRTLNVGDIFGIANLYGADDPFPSQIITVTQAKILFIDAEAFKKYIENDPIATKNYIKILSKKIIFLNKKIATLTAGTAEQKLAVYLSEHQTNNLLQVESVSVLAGILKMGRASLYRAIDDLSTKGIIKKDGKTFIILNEEKLKNI